jgi:hypothetical protein
MFDEQRAILAARVLTAADGWPALAEALESSDAHWGWDATTVGSLIGAFRGAKPAEVARVFEQSGVSPDALFALCTAAQIAQLAAALGRDGTT